VAELSAEVEAFLFHEAQLLDEGRFEEWLQLLTDDVVYQVPVRATRERGGPAELSDEMFHMDETRRSLELRVERLRTGHAWAEDPPSRTRHFLSNLRIRQLPWPEVEVRSNLLLYRNRGSDSGHDLLSGERIDVLRRQSEGWQLARRRVILDQVTLGTKNLGIFL
jgi:ethylbenzene dioxygenase beta subunit